MTPQQLIEWAQKQPKDTQVIFNVTIHPDFEQSLKEIGVNTRMYFVEAENLEAQAGWKTIVDGDRIEARGDDLVLVRPTRH